jgi:hypothetical protein
MTMMKHLLLASAAVAFSTVPAYAQDLNASLTFNNNIDTSLVTSSELDADIDIDGDINIDGDIDVDAAAIAVGDTKQITNGLEVLYHEPDEDDAAGSTNTADSAGVDADGNVGVNSAAGFYNSQSNVATIAVATGGENMDAADSGGAAHANTTAAQSLTGTFYGPADEDQDHDDTNMATSGAVMGDGNIGFNSAAGAFNQQQNVMTLAVATDSALAQATAGVVQYNDGNMVWVNDSVNMADAGMVMGAGNIHVNSAAGVGNQQHNSLTVAASGAFGGNGVGGAGAGGL